MLKSTEYINSTLLLTIQAMKLSPTAKKTSTVGEIVNLMSVDTQKLQDAPMFVNYIWLVS